MKLSQVLQTWGLNQFARRAWQGQGVVRRNHGGYLLEVDGGVSGGGVTVPFAFSIEDATADDWVLVERRFP